MKTLIFFLTVLLFASCSFKTEQVYQLKGKTYNENTAQMDITVDNKQYNLKVDSLGCFNLNLIIKKPTYINLNNEFSLFASLGDKQSIQIFKNAIFFSGDGKEINQYLLQKKLMFSEVLRDLDYNVLYSSSPKDFKSRIDSLLNLLYEPLKNSIDTRQFNDKEFVKSEMLKYKYLHYYYLSTYYQYSQFYETKKLKSSDSYYSFISYADFSDESLLQFKEYRDFVIAYTKDLAFLASIEHQNENVDTSLLFEIIVERNFSENNIKEYVISQLLPSANQNSHYETNEFTVCER